MTVEARSGRLHSVIVDDQDWDEAARVARRRGENVSIVIRRALREYARDNDWP